MNRYLLAEVSSISSAALTLSATSGYASTIPAISHTSTMSSMSTEFSLEFEVGFGEWGDSLPVRRMPLTMIFLPLTALGAVAISALPPLLLVEVTPPGMLKDISGLNGS